MDEIRGVTTLLLFKNYLWRYVMYCGGSVLTVLHSALFGCDELLENIRRSQSERQAVDDR